jgi:hypothetical protein
MSSIIKLSKEDLSELHKHMGVGECNDAEVAYKTIVRSCRISENRVEAKVIKKQNNGNERVLHWKAMYS